MWDAGLEGWLICSVLQVCFKKCAADKMKGVSSSERGNMNAAVLRSPQRELMSMCVSAGTTMCFTTCWLEPVTRRGRPSTCSNLRNTTTSTRSAHKNTNTDVDSKVNADFWTDFTLISYVTKCLKSRFYGGKKKKAGFQFPALVVSCKWRVTQTLQVGWKGWVNRYVRILNLLFLRLIGQLLRVVGNMVTNGEEKCLFFCLLVWKL